MPAETPDTWIRKADVGLSVKDDAVFQDETGSREAREHKRCGKKHKLPGRTDLTATNPSDNNHRGLYASVQPTGSADENFAVRTEAPSDVAVHTDQSADVEVPAQV